MRFKDVPADEASTLKRFVRLDRFDEHLELHRLDCVSSHGHLENYEFVRRFLAETPPDEVRPPRLVTGDDLISLGYQARAAIPRDSGSGRGSAAERQDFDPRRCPASDPRVVQAHAEASSKSFYCNARIASVTAEGHSNCLDFMG